MSGRELKAAIVGCNGIALQKALPSLAKIPEVAVTAFCDIAGERAQSAAKQYGAKGAGVYTDYRELLLDKTLDVVYVCTPNITHAPITIAALEAGKHVMCEKPMATSCTDAKAMLDAAVKSGKKLSVSYQNRFRQDVQTLWRYCRGGALGQVYFAKAHAIRRRGVPTWGVFLNEELQGGGPLIDIGTHSLDLALWLMDDYRVRYVAGSTYRKLAETGGGGNMFGPWEPKKFTVEDSAFGYVVMESGATIMLESSWALNALDEKEAKVTLCGTKAGADMDDGLRLNGEAYDDLYIRELGTGKVDIDYYSGDIVEPGELEARSWIDCILNDTPPVVEPEQAVAVTRILEAVYRSAREGAPVFLD